MAANSNIVGFTSLVASSDVWNTRVVPFLTMHELAAMELCFGSSSTSTSVGLTRRIGIVTDQNWRTLVSRDFDTATRFAPVWCQTREGFCSLALGDTYKQAYQNWVFFSRYTSGAISPSDIRLSIDLWNRYKHAVKSEDGDYGITASLEGALARLDFSRIAALKLPSSYAAFFAVHGGQALETMFPTDWTCGVFGHAFVYDEHVVALQSRSTTGEILEQAQQAPEPANMITIALKHGSNGANSYAVTVGLNRRNKDKIELWHRQHIAPPVSRHAQAVAIAEGGVLEYFKAFVERLESQVYAVGIHLGAGICLFPASGPNSSCVATRGVEVRASARWILDATMQANFAYQISIRLLEGEDGSPPTPCQLVGRHWEFTDGNGRVQRVDGEAVVGKQPLFLNAHSFVDLGRAGDGLTYNNEVFTYTSQSGDMEGAFESDSVASFCGSFSFVPGSIAEPTGPVFHASVGRVSLTRSIPFY